MVQAGKWIVRVREAVAGRDAGVCRSVWVCKSNELVHVLYLHMVRFEDCSVFPEVDESEV